MYCSLPSQVTTVFFEVKIDHNGAIVQQILLCYLDILPATLLLSLCKLYQNLNFVEVRVLKLV